MALKDDSVREDEEETLREFLADSECLEPLSEWTRRLNVLDVLKITNTEIRHSNVLAWLMDPAENHGLHDGVIRGFVAFAARRMVDDGGFDDLLMDCDGFSIRREWRNIDILAVNEKEKYVLCIENKIFSDEHDDQLARYRAEIEREFPDCRRRFVFLTPNSGEASESDWLAMGYGDVLDIIDRAVETAAPAPETARFIADYMDTVRRNILGDRELEDICKRIYAKHKRALDLIYEHRPDVVSTISNCCRKWIGEKAGNDKTIKLRKDTGDKWDTVFTTNLLPRLLPGIDEPSGIWGEYGHCVYQIHVNDDKDVPRVRLQLVFNFDGLDERLRGDCEEVIHAIEEVYKKVRIGKRWCIAWATDYSAVPIDSEEEWDKSLAKTLDGMLRQLKRFEGKLSEKQ